MKKDDAPIIVSYARSDAEVALQLVKGLREAGANIWLDQLDILKGQPWDDAVQAAIGNANAMIVLLSQDSVASPNVKDEIAEAFDSGVRIIPVIISECKVPLRLKRIQYIDATRGDAEAITDILNALRSTEQTITTSGHRSNETSNSVSTRSTNSVNLEQFQISRLLYLTTAALALIAAVGFYVFPMHTYSDYTSIPSLDEATKKDEIVGSDQLSSHGGRLLQKETPITLNGYFTFLLPKYDGITSHPDAKESGGVELLNKYEPNLYMTTQVKPIHDINTIDLIACGIALVVKIRSKALFFWASESDASPRDIPIDIDFENANTIALRQVDQQVTAFVNGKAMAEYTFNTKPESCTPRLFFKVNTDREGEAYFQGLAVYEFAKRNALGRPVPKWLF